MVLPLSSFRIFAGSWNLFLCDLAIPSDATGLTVSLSANQSSSVADGTEYVIFSDVRMTPICDIKKIINSYVVDSLKAFRWAGPCIVTYGAAAPTDTDLQGVVGDMVINTAPTINANNMILREWICTTAGSPGTWTPQYYSTVSTGN